LIFLFMKGNPMTHQPVASSIRRCEAAPCANAGASLEGASLDLCADHAAMAPFALRARLSRATGRRKFLQTLWDNEAAYDSIVASGRYLKLAHASCCAEENEEAARQSLLLAVLLRDSGMDSQTSPQGVRLTA
jgi:hypothetical protein